MVCFFEFLTPLIWGGRNFLKSTLFWWFLVHQMCQLEGVQVLFGCQKQQNPRLGFDLLWALKCLVTGPFTLMFFTILSLHLVVPFFSQVKEVRTRFLCISFLHLFLHASYPKREGRTHLKKILPTPHSTSEHCFVIYVSIFWTAKIERKSCLNWMVSFQVLPCPQLELNGKASSVTMSSTDLSFQNLVFWNLFEFSAAEITNHQHSQL